MRLLPTINTPADLKKLSVDELPTLAAEIRKAIFDQVSKVGGHLAPNLGVVELTIALHYVFDFGHDRLLPECARRGIAVFSVVAETLKKKATGARPGATYLYQEAPPEIMERTRRIEAVCARHGVPLAAAALQFAAFHPAVATVVVGMRNATDLQQNAAYFRHGIPPALWEELKHEGLIARAAPTA